MARIIVTGPADNDIATIIADLGNLAGQRIANAFHDSLERLFDRLSAFPDSGSLRPALGSLIRIAIIPPYIIVYRHDSTIGAVNILRVIYGSRRIAEDLLQP